MLAFHILQHGHLLDRYLVEFLEAFSLWQTFVNEYCIQVLHITQTNQLVNSRVVTDIAPVNSIQRLGDKVKAFKPA